MLPEWLSGRKIGIFGFGVNNAKLTEWLIVHGANDLCVYEENSERAAVARQILDDVSDTPSGSLTTLRGRSETSQRRAVVSDVDAFVQATDRDVIFRSPGIHTNHPALVAARTRGARISSQTDLFLELCPARTVGITGTKGKGTTASLLTHLLIAQRQTRNGKDNAQIYLAGNIGLDPFEFLDDLTADDTVVLELSSGQLQDVTHSPNLAIVLDITPDHLDYHASFQEYVTAKRPIVRYQKKIDRALINCDSEISMRLVKDVVGRCFFFSTMRDVVIGSSLRGEVVHFRDPGHHEQSVSLAALSLLGPHNRVNATAAVTAALLLGAEASALEAALAIFPPLPHRLETVAFNDGVTWVNDSYATVPAAATAALKSFTNPIILIAGGRSKGLPLEPLSKAIASCAVTRLLTIGSAGSALTHAAIEAGFSREKTESTETLERAVRRAAELARPGDVVLLSPGFTSLDQFSNATERGDRFRRLVAEQTQ